MQTLLYPLSVLYRFILAFGIGYACSYLLSINLIDIFYPYLAKAESIYLAAFIALLFYIIFVLVSFCIQSLKKMSIISFVLVIVLLLFSKFIG
ncbi:hypothetical protein OSH00_06765 [Acinetobacter sp. A-IN1]|uniref:Uncharacterized protein n=1 Tax=Acinetobacter nematophilus TaxID=2994642 RepID=A0A9X3DSY4_9GAMM|nr:hypothetical protein [Acinetobacter nematophilus]MCX5467446.1 hypothetical protein [Acinetobacter nematophilus]